MSLKDVCRKGGVYGGNVCVSEVGEEGEEVWGIRG